jgi:signal transduction histidine kinase
VIVDCIDTREEVLVAVCDDGPGIADIVAGEPISIDPSLPGTGKFPALAAALAGGSGLMFVSEVVALNGGSTTVERNLNGGTSVTMKFPKP